VVGVLIVLPFLGPIAREMAALQPHPAKMTAEFHMLFNIALAAIFIGPLNGVAWLLERMPPERKQPIDPNAPRRPESLETTSLHLDILSDLKRVHSHSCSVAYPVLEAAGELKPIRFEANSIENANAAAGLLPAPPHSA
jgi:Na+/phosphate symporter